MISYLIIGGIVIAVAVVLYRRDQQQQLDSLTRAIAVDIALISADFLKDDDNEEDIEDYINIEFPNDNFNSPDDALISLHSCILAFTVLFSVAYPTRNFSFADKVLKFLITNDFPQLSNKIVEIYNASISVINYSIANKIDSSPAEVMSQILRVNNVSIFNPINIGIIEHVINSIVILKSRYPNFYADIKQ